MKKVKVRFGLAPFGEVEPKIGDLSYATMAVQSSEMLIAQLSREHDVRGIKFDLISNRHEFGNYFEIEASVDEDDVCAVGRLTEIDGSFPEFWDELSMQKLNG